MAHMKFARIAILCGAALTLNACATVGGSAKVSEYVCKHKVAIATAARAALTASYSIKDPTRQHIAQDAANATLSLVALCPLDGDTSPG